ncbi:DUF2442 domain-containing protein [Phyllobacterium leguminum]|uniref:Uncharacterized protein DUF2442 n=1 Tax=Phyllobacterium leguminum TaxID=314237 RepID=A0A318T4F1_9HYPH|nr:DUF2442 domain-containing protein [Phyllobacterium leguminum]PYE89733.1 uncharacterized protein DUF2442 [Phyllobacterium leguminum]
MNGTVSIPEDYDENEIISVGAPLPRIREAIPLDGRKIQVTFDDGHTKTIDLAPALGSRRYFIPLRDNDELFRSFKIADYRNAIEWSDDLDFSAMGLDALPPVDFSNEDFRNAMDEMRMTLDGMASMLDISRRLVADYRKAKPIPRHIGFATRYLVEYYRKKSRFS